MRHRGRRHPPVPGPHGRDHPHTERRADTDRHEPAVAVGARRIRRDRPDGRRRIARQPAVRRDGLRLHAAAARRVRPVGSVPGRVAQRPAGRLLQARVGPDGARNAVEPGSHGRELESERDDRDRRAAVHRRRRRKRPARGAVRVARPLPSAGSGHRVPAAARTGAAVPRPAAGHDDPEPVRADVDHARPRRRALRRRAHRLPVPGRRGAHLPRRPELVRAAAGLRERLHHHHRRRVRRDRPSTCSSSRRPACCRPTGRVR